MPFYSWLSRWNYIKCNRVDELFGTQEYSQTQDMNRSQHLVKVPYSVETQDSIKGLESDKKPVDETQNSVCSEDSNKINYSIQGQNAVFKNARCLVLTLSPNLVARRMPHLKSVKPKSQKQIASSKFNQHSVYGLVLLSLAIKRQKSRRKILHRKSKFSLQVSPQKSKKTPISWVFQVTVCPVCASKRSKLGCKYNTKKKEWHQGKGLSDKALHLIYVSKLVFPYIKKYSRRKLVKVLPGLTGCRHFLPKQNKSLAAEKVSYAGAIEKRGTSGNTENVKQHGRDHKGLKNISPKISPQLQQSSMVNTYQLKLPCSLLIEINGKNRESLKDPTAQAKETDTAEFHTPICKKAPDLHIPKHEIALEEAILEHLQKFVFSPKTELNRGMKTWEELKSTEHAHLPLSNEEKSPASTPEKQRCFPKGNIQKQRDFLEVVLEFSAVSSLISLGTKKHSSSEQLAGAKIQESTEDIILKDKQPLIVTVTECDNLSESEDLGCNIRINIKNMQDERISEAFHSATVTISEPPCTEMHSRLKDKIDTSEIMGLSHSAIKQEKLANEKKVWNANYIEKSCIFREHDREEEEQAPQEVPHLTQDFRVSLQLKQKPKYVKFEIGQSSSGSRKIQNKEQEAQPQTLSTQMIPGTSPCPTVDSFQVEKVKQSRDGPIGRESAETRIPLTVPENLPAGEVFIETPECGVPFGESPRKTLDDHIAKEKECLKRVLPAVVLRSFIIHMLPLLYLKRQKTIQKLPGTKSALNPKCVNMKVKKPAILLVSYINRCGTPSHRKRFRGNFKILIKQMLLNKIVADVLRNVIYRHVSILPHIRTHNKLNTENHNHTKLKQEKSQVGRGEECSDSINKESDSGNTPEEAKLQDEVRGDKEAPSRAVLCGHWNFGLDACPEEELKTEKELHQPITFAETIMQSSCSFIMEPSHENMKKSLTTQTDLKCTAESEMPSPASEKSLIGDPLNQTRESGVPDHGSETGEMGYCFAETKTELPKDLPATLPQTSKCHVPILTHSKLKKKGVRFSPIECRVKPKSVHLKAMKPSISELSNITGHREKLKSNFKNKFEKINQANGMVYEFLNNLYSPMHSRLQVEENSFSHAQVKQGKLTDEGRPQYVDFFDKNNAFYNREEKVQDGEEMEQKTLLEAAPQDTWYFWADACQEKETHLDKPDPTLDCLTQELQYQTCFTQTALQNVLQTAPREAEGLQKTNQTENDMAPLGLKSLPAKAGNSSLDKCLNTVIECGLSSSRNPKKQLDSCFMEKISELQKGLQVISLKSSDSVEFFISKSKGKKNTSKIGRKRTIMSCRYRTMRGKKPSISHMLNDRQSKELRCKLKTKMKNPQQKKNIIDASLDSIHSKLPILPNIKMSSVFNVETDMQRITRLGHMQLMQEQLPNGRKVCCPDSIDVSSLSSSVKDGKEEGKEYESLPASKNSQAFIFNACQKENNELAKTDEELKQPGSVDIQVQPQIDFSQTILDSASCPIFDQFQFGKPEKYARFSPPKSGEAKTDEIFSAREHVVPSDANHQKEQRGSIEKKETETFDCCISAFSTSKRKKNIKQYSDIKTLVNPKCRILKAKKPSISYIFNIKGGASPNHRRELGCNLTTKMKEVDQGKKMAGKIYSFMTITPDINMYSKIEREKDTLGGKQLSFKQETQVISLHEGNVISDDTEETNSRQFESNFRVMMEESVPVADIMLNVISSAMPISLDMNMNNRMKAETDMPWEMRPSDELQQQEQAPDRERAWCANSSDEKGSASSSMKKVKVLGGEAAPRNSQHFGFKAHKTKKPHFVRSGLQLKNSARKKIPESLSTSQELQRQTLLTQHVLRSISHSILHLLSLQELRKRTKTQKGLKETKSPTILSPMPRKSMNESLIVTAQSGIPFEKCPRKELAGSIPEGKIRLQKGLPARTLELFYFSMPGSSDLKGQRNAAQIPKSRTGKAQMVLKTINITRSSALSHGKQQDPILENMVKEISLCMSNMFINTSLSSTPVSPAINIHKKVKTKKSPLRKKSNITRCWEQGEGKQDEGRLCTYSCNKWSTSDNTLESGWQNEKNKEDSEILFEAGLPFLNTMISRKDQNMLIVEQDVQKQTLVSENISESICSTLMIPFQTKKLKKTIPLQEDILHTIVEKISCSKSGKTVFDDLLVDETEYSATSDGSHTRKLGVHNAVSLQPKEGKEDMKAQKVIKYTVDQNIPPTKSGDSVLGDPCVESSRRNMGGHIAKKCEVQRDLITMSTMSVLSESKRQKRVLKFPERRNLAGSVSVTMKTKKTICSQILTITEHANLYYRKEQECNFNFTIKDMKQNKSIANTFSSPTHFSTDKKIDTEMYSTLKAETDQQRAKLHNPTYRKLEESPCYREAQKANSTGPQNRSSYTMKMNVQQNKEEVGVETINLMFPTCQEKKIQGSKDEPAVLLAQSSTSLPSLPLLKLDKEMQRISNAVGIVHTEPISGEIIKDVQNKKPHLPQEEERDTEKTVAMRVMINTADISLKSKKSTSSYVLHRTELHVNIGRPGQKKHEGQGKPPGTVLRKVYVSKPVTNLKLDKGTQVDEEELGIKRPPLFLQMVSALSDAEKTEDTETVGGDVRKIIQDLSQKEKDREQNKVDEDLLEMTGFSPSQLQLLESSGAGNIKHADSKGSSCITIIKANQHAPYKDSKDRVKIEDGKGRLLPKIITLRVETSPLTSRKRLPLTVKEQVKDVEKDKGKPEMVLRKTCASSPSPSHLKRGTKMSKKEDILGTTQSCFPPLKIQDTSNSGKKAYTKSFEGYMLEEKDRLKRGVEDKMLPIYTDLKTNKLPLLHILNTKELQCKIKEQKRKVQEDKNKLVMNIKNTCTSLLTLPCLKFDTTEREGYMITITKVPLPQLQSKESSDAFAETTDGELSNDVKELKVQKDEKDGEKSVAMNSIVDPNDTYLNANKSPIVLTSAAHVLKKKSPILLIYNLSDLQRKTKEPKGKVQKVTCEPAGVMLTKTWTSSSSPLHINMNVSIKEKSMLTLTRSSVSPVNFQESSDSKEVIYVEPIIPDILISPQEGKQRMPQNKEVAGTETDLMFPTHQEKKMQESKEYGFNKPKKIALRKADDSGIFTRSLSISVMTPSQTEETVESETNLEREKRIWLSKFQKKSSNASEIVKRNNSSVVEKGGQNFTNVAPEDSQPFVADQQQMQNLPSVISEENLSSKINKKNLTLQTEERVVPGHDISKVTKEPDWLTTEQEEKAPNPILTPIECPCMSEDPKENVETLSVNVSPPGIEEPQHETQLMDTRVCASPPEHRDQSEPIQDTTTQKVQQQKTVSGNVPLPPQVKSNEIKIMADSTGAESLCPLYEAVKNVAESQIKNMIQEKVYAEILGKVKAHYPDDWESPPFAGGSDTTSTTIQPKLQPKPILESKALDIKLNLIPKMAKQSFQKFNFYSKQTISEDNNQRLYSRHKKLCFLSLDGIDTIKRNLKHEYQKDSPPISCRKTPSDNVSSGREVLLTKLKSISELENGTSSVTSANNMPLSQILQNYSVEEKDKLLMHFSMKTLEIQMKAFPRIVRESYAMADTQDRRKPLSKCIHSGVKVPNQKNRILLLFEEKSLHQIELDLQCKYLRFLLGLPVESMFLKPNILPKHSLKLNTVAMCKKVDNSGESSSISIDRELLEQHISLKKQSPRENSSSIRRFLEPTHVCASDPEQHGTAQKDTTVLSVLKSQVTTEKDKHHVWFQEIDTHESFELKTQENAPGLVDYHSVQTSQDFTECQTDMESSANLEECSGLGVHESEESMFLEAKPYLSWESKNMLFKLQKGIPLENFYKRKQIETDLKPFYSDKSGSHYIGGYRKPFTTVTPPSYKSCKSGKFRSSSKMQSPDWVCHSSLNTAEAPFVSYSVPFSDEKLSCFTKNRTRYSLASLAESNIKLHLAKSQDIPHRHPESKERKKAKLDLFRKNFHWDPDHSYTRNKEKCRRKKDTCDYESERADYSPSKHKSASKLHQEDINFHTERKQNQPFFYACVPADSVEIIPKTICWTIPQKTLRKRNFRVPLVAKMSSSCNM